MRLRRGLFGWRPQKRRLTPAGRDAAEQLRLERETARLQNRHGAVQAESRHQGGNLFYTFFGGGG
jgi:hypothetical protein